MFITNSTLRILCFGDSLTQGWSLSTNPIVHPYAGNLETTLKTAFPPVNISTDVQGVGGDQTECPPGRCPGFLPRMQKLCELKLVVFNVFVSSIFLLLILLCLHPIFNIIHLDHN